MFSPCSSIWSKHGLHLVISTERRHGSEVEQDRVTAGILSQYVLPEAVRYRCQFRKAMAFYWLPKLNLVNPAYLVVIMWITYCTKLILYVMTVVDGELLLLISFYGVKVIFVIFVYLCQLLCYYVYNVAINRKYYTVHYQ